MKTRLTAITAAAVLLAPAVAHAHLVATGMGPVYDGVSHFALSPEDSLPVVALAFFAGLRGPRHARLLLAVLPLSWLLGGLLSALLTGATGLTFAPVAPPVVTAALLLLTGGLLVANLDLSPRLCAIPAIALGLARGATDVAGIPAGASVVLPLLGMSGGVFVVFALAASVTLPLRRAWMIVAARVSGSWVAAAGLLLAGWIIHYGASVQ